MSRKQVHVGIIGVGSVWESRYQPALAQLRDRIQVAAVSDAISLRAQQVARSLNCDAVDGALQMAHRHNLHAILLLETGWYGNELLRLLLRTGKPIFVAASLGSNCDEINRLRQRIETAGTIVVPEFAQRYTPASGRFQELLATRLGQPHQITMDAVVPNLKHRSEIDTQMELLANLFDWCHRIIRSSPHDMQVKLRMPTDSPTGWNAKFTDLEVLLEYPQAADPDHTIYVGIRLRTLAGNLATKQPGVPATASILYEATCEHGHVMMNSETDIAWNVDDNVTRESLTTDDSSIEVMLDHFCRRVVGGLIPVADLTDVARSVGLALQVKEALLEGR